MPMEAGYSVKKKKQRKRVFKIDVAFIMLTQSLSSKLEKERKLREPVCREI